MEDRLYHAALEGSVSTLRQLIREDPLILDRVTLGFPSETPLHVAAMRGHHEFANEILRLKPELSKELDTRGSSPLHLASAKGYLDIVKSLLLTHPTMCFASDAEGRNPLHLAAMRGQIHVLTELIQSSPLATEVRLERGDTILHICVKSNQLETLKFLVENIADDVFVNAKDYYGFTILHLAVIEKQVQVVLLISKSMCILYIRTEPYRLSLNELKGF